MDEFLDIVDQNDKVIETTLRSQVYDQGLEKNRYIRVVNILLFDEKGVLFLPKRSANRLLFPNCYDFSCGEHVEAGETYDEAALRGVQEELGIERPNLEFLGKLGPQEGVSGFMQIYKIVSNVKNFDFNANEIQSFEWHTIEDVINKINKNPSGFKSDLLPVLQWYISKYY